MRNDRYYFIHSQGMIEPEIHGSWNTAAKRDKAAKQFHASEEYDLEDDVIFWLDVPGDLLPEGGCLKRVKIGSYAGGFWEDEQDPPERTDENNHEFCSKCGKHDPENVQERFSFGVYAGRLCSDCCIDYRDHCGIDQPQGDPSNLDEPLDPEETVESINHLHKLF